LEGAATGGCCTCCCYAGLDSVPGAVLFYGEDIIMNILLLILKHDVNIMALLNRSLNGSITTIAAAVRTLSLDDKQLRQHRIRHQLYEAEDISV
jgi:hypothetical protein